jgi:hypothetical protein
VVLGGATARELLRRGRVRQVRLQTLGGQTLIGAPVEVDVAQTVPRVFKAPAWAAAGAISLVARVAGLQIVVERDE